LALSFDAVFVATAVVATVTAVVSVVAGLAATVLVTVAAADVAAVVMFISSSSFADHRQLIQCVEEKHDVQLHLLHHRV